MIGLGAENCDRVGLFLQLARKQQREEIGAEDGDGLSLFAAEHAAQVRLCAEAPDRELDGADGDGVADLAEAAFAFAGGLAAGGEDQREGRDLFIELQRLLEIPVRGGLHEGAHVELQRAGGAAEWRLLVNAARRHRVHLLLGDLVDLIDVGGAALLDLAHVEIPPGKRMIREYVGMGMWEKPTSPL